LRIYLTHCCASKNEQLKGTDIRVTPDKLYTSSRTQKFMNTCKETKVNWAILSDKYGIWFPNIKHMWYEKHPKTVTESELEALVKDFEQKLEQYDEIYFYYHPGRFHKLYKRLLESVRPKGRVIPFIHLAQIE